MRVQQPLRELLCAGRRQMSSIAHAQTRVGMRDVGAQRLSTWTASVSVVNTHTLVRFHKQTVFLSHSHSHSLTLTHTLSLLHTHTPSQTANADGVD